MQPWPIRSWHGVVAAALVLAGCGSSAAGPVGPAVRSTGLSASASAAGTGSSRPDPSRAGALARHLVAEMTVPPGTKPFPARSLPRAMRDTGPPAGQGWVRAERVLLAPVTPAAAWAVVEAHAPFNEPGAMGPAVVNGLTGSSTLLPAPEPGVAAAQVAVWAEPWSHGTTLIAAYAYATPRPVRTAAEHLDPGRFSTVTVTVTTYIPHVRTTTRTFTSAAVIARLAAFLNARPAAPQIAVPCPAPAASYQLRFTAKAGDPVLTVSDGCLTDQIAVNGAQQPSVWDNDGGLGKLVRSVLRR
jgi:hypothetical protein